MKHSLKNDTGLNATLPVNPPGTSGIPSYGPTSAPSQKLLDGKLQSFKNAESEDAPDLKSYNFSE